MPGTPRSCGKATGCATAILIFAIGAGGLRADRLPHPNGRGREPGVMVAADRFEMAADPALAPPLTVAQLEQLAWQQNPTVAQAAERVRALRGKYQQAGLYPNPRVGYVGSEIGSGGRAGKQGIAVEQRIVTAGKLRWNRSVVAAEIGAAEHEWSMQRLRVGNDVRAAAYGVIAARQTVELSHQLFQVAEEVLVWAERLHGAGEVSRLDVLRARIEANQGRLAREQAQHALAAAWRGLAAVVGEPDLPPVPIVDPADVESAAGDWESARRRLLAESPELRRAEAELDRAEAAWGRACAGRVPDVELGGGVAYAFAANETIAQVGVAVPLQLFDRNQGNIRRAEAELAAARQELRRVELALQNRLAGEFRDYLNARETVKHYREAILPDASDALELVRRGYEQGELDYLELLGVQQTYFRTHLAYVEARRAARVRRVQIEGLLLGGGLAPPGG